MIYEFTVNSEKRNQFINIDRQIKSYIDKSGISDGICKIFIPHTTAAVTINENADPDVVRDLDYALGQLVPNDSAFRHGEGNSDAHVKTSLIGTFTEIFIRNGSMALGTWQSVYFCEFDGPRQRRVWIKVLPD